MILVDVANPDERPVFISMHSAPKPSVLSFRQIEELAEVVARQYDFNSERENSLALARRLGGIVACVATGKQEQLEGGSLVVDGPGRFSIFLSPITGVLRDNFTTAHELGHYFLHTGDPVGSEAICAGRWGNGLVEQQANRFAAALLMPRERFISAAQRVENDPYVLAGRFGVSGAAAEARLKSIGLRNN